MFSLDGFEWIIHFKSNINRLFVLILQQAIFGSQQNYEYMKCGLIFLLRYLPPDFCSDDRVWIVGFFTIGHRFLMHSLTHTHTHTHTHTYLDSRTNACQAVFRVRNALARATHQFFQNNGFLYLHAPIITAHDCEGAGEMFSVTSLLSQAEEAAKLPMPTEEEVKVLADRVEKIEATLAALRAEEKKDGKKIKKV